jgi:hypothetical protein
MQKAERDAIVREGVVLPETPRRRRERAALEEDLRTIALAGKPLPIRARHFRPSADVYLLATRGPLPYMLRLREIEQRTEAHEATRVPPGWLSRTSAPRTTRGSGSAGRPACGRRHSTR